MTGHSANSRPPRPGAIPRPNGVPRLASERPPRRSERPVAPRSWHGLLDGKRITLCVSGSIAAYKAALVTRLLVKEGAKVEVVLTESAKEFIGASTFSGLTGKPVLSDMFQPGVGGELHVDLAARSELVLIVPATADLLARMAQGRAGDLVAALALCASCPVLAAPAMHPSMWSHPATQRNVASLEADRRVSLVGPVAGEVASGEMGIGRMAEPEEIIAAAIAHLASDDLRGRHIVVSAGPTVEDVDPVRFLSNRSSGKMGFALAERAAARGARVTLVSGPVKRATPYGVQRVDVRSAVAMRGAVWQALGPDLGQADALIMAAAVGDYRPSETHATKLKRGKADPVAIELTENPDILAEVGQARRGAHPVLVGFAVEADSDEAVIGYARDKLTKKRVDLIVANHADDSFGRDDNRATLVGNDSERVLERLPKLVLADRILDWLVGRLDARAG